jgi:hypothetical protein
MYTNDTGLRFVNLKAPQSTPKPIAPEQKTSIYKQSFLATSSLETLSKYLPVGFSISNITSASSTIKYQAYADIYKSISSLLKDKIGVNFALPKIPDQNSKIRITSFGDAITSPGAHLLIYGTGFSKGMNTVYFNDKRQDVTSNGKFIDAVVPKDLYGAVYVKVVSGGEESNTAGIFVKKQNSKPPQIYTSQKSIKLSDPLIITGTGLTDKNTIYSMFGSVDVPKSGNTLSFKISDIKSISSAINYIGSVTATTSIFVWVVNENGTSNSIGPITIEFK